MDSTELRDLSIAYKSYKDIAAIGKLLYATREHLSCFVLHVHPAAVRHSGAAPETGTPES